MYNIHQVQEYSIAIFAIKDFIVSFLRKQITAMMILN